MKRLLTWIFLLLCVLFAFNTQSANAQRDSRSLRWQRYDVTIDNVDTANNQFTVTESYTLDIIRGPFRFGTASIPMDRLTDIQSLRIAQDETSFSANCSQRPGTFCAAKDKGQFNITYYFLQTANSGDTVRVRLTYTVLGALRSYAGGDQIYWMAIPSDRPFPIAASQVTIHMPADHPPQMAASYPNTWQQRIDGTTVTWTSPASGLSSNDNLEVRIQYPHNPDMKPPLWQSAFDFYQSVKPVIDLGMMALGALFGLGGPIIMYIQYATHGRDPQPVVVPDYLTEPPSAELPGVVGTLVDEKADLQDILATLMDLARRGFIVIEQTETEGIFGMFKGHEFVFHLTDQDKTTLRRPEGELIRSMFSGGDEVTLSSLRNKFYTHIPTLKSSLYEETVRNGYFGRSPETTRTLWMIGGILLSSVGVAVMIFGPDMLKNLTSLAFIPGLGVIISGLAMLIFSPVMPSKTAAGSQEAAKWRAFRKYLSNIKQYTDMSQANELFDKYIGYAVAFGLQQQWFHQFGNVLTSMPTWYYPTYMGGHWSGGYRHGYFGAGPGGSLGDMGGLNAPGGLNQMSSSLSQGLNAMSSGLTQMLNSASSVMTSHPSSSGSSGGWSGGGGFSGGSSGGGSRGFG